MTDLIEQFDLAVKGLKPLHDFWETAGIIGEDRQGDIISISDGTNRARLSYGMLKRAARAYQKLCKLQADRGSK